MVGDNAHAIGIADRGATELLNDESHGPRGYPLTAVTSPCFHPLLSSPVTNEKRERQKQARRERVDEIARLERREVIRQRALLVLLMVALVGGALFLFSRNTEADNTFAPELQGESGDATPTTLDPAAEEELLNRISLFVPPAPGASISGETPCPAEDGSSERTTSFENPPPMCIDPTASYTAVMATDLGDITIALDPAAAPENVNNFVVLARYSYYQDVPFHRIVPEFVIQGGDAVGGGDPDNPTLGVGSPGYVVPDELPAEGAYQVGSFAMANRGPDSASSQFFIVTDDTGLLLAPAYSLIGQVTEGLDVVAALNAIGTPGAGVPTEVVRIQSVTITQG